MGRVLTFRFENDDEGAKRLWDQVRPYLVQHCNGYKMDVPIHEDIPDHVIDHFTGKNESGGEIIAHYELRAPTQVELVNSMKGLSE